MTDEVAPNCIDVGGAARRVALDLERHKLGVLLRLIRQPAVIIEHDGPAGAHAIK